MAVEQPLRLNFAKAMENVRTDALFRPVTRTDNLIKFDERDLMAFFKAIGEKYVRNFAIDESNCWVYDNVRRWADAREFQCQSPTTGGAIPGDVCKGLYICGPTGSGKSVLTSIVRSYLDALRAKIRVGGEEEMMAWVPYRADEICVDYAKNGDLAPYMRARILCIQDAGTEQEETLYMGNRVEVIRTILEYRGDHSNQMTIITSNDKITDEHYGSRVASRLCEMCNYFELKGKDRRIR